MRTKSLKIDYIPTSDGKEVTVTVRCEDDITLPNLQVAFQQLIDELQQAGQEDPNVQN